MIHYGHAFYLRGVALDPLIALFSEVLEVSAEDLSDESSPDSVEEWDSLAAMSLVSAIEMTFDVELSTGEMMKMNTIGIARQVLTEKGVTI